MRTFLFLLSALVFSVIALAPHRALAQTRVIENDFRTREIVDASLLRAGRFSMFLSATGGWAYGSTSSDSAPGTSQNMVFSLPSLGAGYMVTDAFQVRLSVNGIFIFMGVDGAQSQETYGVGGTVQGLYHIPLDQGMALYAGLGAGGFYSTRSAPVGGGLDVNLTGGGFQAQLPVGLLVQPGASLFLRGGIRFDFLVGSESPSSATAGVQGRTFINFLTNAELALGLRF